MNDRIEFLIKQLDRMANKYQLNDIRQIVEEVKHELSTPVETSMPAKALPAIKRSGMKAMVDGLFDQIDDETKEKMRNFINEYE